MPDWAHVHAELRRPGVTLALLWQEYRLAYPQGFQYSWFCEHYRLWAAKIDVVMREEHRAGEKLFVAYAGQTVPAIDRQALQALPEHPYVYAEWKKVRVHIDYHVEVDGHYYSVPCQLVKH